jgi:hypothetical protein
VATALVAAGCAAAAPAPPAAGTRFAAAWKSGQLEAAVEAFESDTSLSHDPTLTFRAGLAYAHPANPARDLRRARELLLRVAASDSTIALARDAASVLALLDAERAQRLQSDALRRELEALKAIDLEAQEPPATDSTGADPP